MDDIIIAGIERQPDSHALIRSNPTGDQLAKAKQYMVR